MNRFAPTPQTTPERDGRSPTNQGPWTARGRILVLLAVCAMLPWLLGALAADDRRLEVTGGGGSYTFVPVCSSRVVQVRHGDAQLRLTNRHGTLGSLGGSIVSHLDGVVTVEKRKNDGPDNNESADVDRMIAVLRAQIGMDWTWIGLRLGVAGGVRRDSLPTSTGSFAVQTSFFPLPAASLRLGPPLLHGRIGIADGTWDPRFSAFNLGLGFSLADVGPDSHDVGMRGFVGFGADIVDSNKGYFVFGLRIPIENAEIGLQGRVGGEGASGNVYLGLPLR